MDNDTLMFFDKMPDALPLYEALEARMHATLGPFTKKVQKTQISFYNKHGFAWAWLPIGRIKKRPKACILVTFGLDRRLDSPRIFEATEPYPRRWTHHVLVEDAAEIDDELMGWIQDSYNFSMIK